MNTKHYIKELSIFFKNWVFVFDLITSLLEFSSLRKSNTRFGATGIQKEVAALKTMPGGLPGSSMLFRVMTRTSSDPVVDNVVQACAVDAPTPLQKLITILSASFSMLFLPSGLVITFIITTK